ncbi:TPA: hypothetical protein H1016_04315, partial [archaeon]|nr:hypothetical protein [Candidatus Naiadarchaeum limnaeum]
GGGGEGEGGKKRKDIDIDFEKKDEHRKTPHEGDSLLMRIIGPVERTAEGVALVAKGAKIDFEEHLVIINDVSINRVNITISSTPVNLLLEVGKPGYVDFDNDDRADVKIVVNSISGDNTDISFTSYRTLRILSYPAEIYIPQGSSDLYIITTINNGVNEQKDISLSVSGAPYSINITPLIIPGLKKNEIAIFAMSLYVPDDAIVGMDKLLLEITSNRITKDYDIGLHIDENLEKSFEKREIKRLEREIANAQFVANEIWNVALQKQIQGFDVSRVLTHLRIVNRNLAEAKTALTPGKLEKASGLVLVAKKHIEEAVILLSKAKISPSSVLLYAAVIGFAAFVIFAIAKYAKGIKKKISRKKELKEVEEKLEEWEER